jgi:general secretion pathway protein H
MRKAIQSSRTGNGGYTLVELLVVLTVISLIIAATPVVVSAARPGAQARAATYALADAFRGARVAAIMAGTDRVVVLDLLHRTYVTSDGTTRQLPDSVQWEFEAGPGAVVDDQARLRFYPDGSSSGGRIRIMGAGPNRLIVNHRLTGRISIDE